MANSKIDIPIHIDNKTNLELSFIIECVIAKIIITVYEDKDAKLFPER